MDVSDVETFRKAKRKAILKNNLSEVANLCNALGDILARQGKFAEALEEHQEELSVCEATQDAIGIAVAQRKIGECYSELGNYEEALLHQKKYLELAQATDNVVEEQRAYATIGRTFLFQAEPLIVVSSSSADDYLDKAEDAFMKSLGICSRLKEKVSQKELMEMKSRLYLNLGLVCENKGNVKQCAELIKQAIHINVTHDLKEDLHRCHYSLAQIFRRRDNLSQALRHLDEAFACAEKLKDKELQCETLLSKAQILLILDDSTGARLYLKKAFKFDTTNEADKREIKRFLKHAVTLCRVEDSLVPISDDDFKNRLPLYEKLGDTFANVGNFKQALEYYHKTLRCAEKLGYSASEKAPLYYSVAQTYMDLKQCSDAIEYYNKEIECRAGNYKEECKTLLNISDCELLRGESYEKVNEILQAALDKAKKARKPSLEMNCLKALICAQEKFALDDEQRVTNELLAALKEEYDLSSDDDTSNCESSQNIHPAESSDISDLSDSEGDVEEYDCPKRRSTSNNVLNKRNEKGETPLHRACIAGNLGQVRRLIEKGHPVNPRDNCGWLPLHEAANHDCYEIVEYLLDHGAWVNDRGGIYCDGITPLHDAASCGNVKIMRLLVERGASVFAKTNDVRIKPITIEGETPLDCLVKWRVRAGEDLSRSLLNECREMENYLKEAIEKLGHSVSITQDSLCYTGTPSKEDGEHKRKSRLFSSGTSSDSEEDLPTPVTVLKKPQRKKRDAGMLYSSEDEASASQLRQFKSRKKDEDVIEEPFTSNSDEMIGPSQRIESVSDSEGNSSADPPKRDEDLDDLSEVRQEYIDAISSMRSASARLGQQEDLIQPVGKSAKSALVDENDIIVDDWLVEDMGEPATSANKKCEVAAMFGGSRRAASKSDLKSFVSRHKLPSISHVIRTKSKAPNKLRQTKLRAVCKSNDNYESADFESPKVVNIQESMAVNSDVEYKGVDRLKSTGIVGPVTGAPLRIKVRIQDKLLLVPVTQGDIDQTVSWLSEEAANRYYCLSGLKPVLRLSTVEGAALAYHDKLVDVVNGNEEILATLQHWDLPPLPERYVTSCQSLNAVVYSNIRSALQNACDSRILVVDNMGLRAAMTAPLFRALQCQYGLRHLSLGGNCIGDEGVKLMATAITTLPNLLTLNICCNNITTAGLRSLRDSVEDNQNASNLASAVKPLQLLTDLNLSYNSLGDSSGAVLGDLLHGMPSLVSLQIASCNITQQAFSSNKNQLSTGLKAAVNLRSIDVAYNSLGVSGLGHFLKCLLANRVMVLNLTSTVKEGSRNEITILAQHLKAYMMQADCSLEELHLDDCSLTDECVCAFAVSLRCSSRLRLLSLAVNPKLTVASIGAITNSLKERSTVTFDCLDISGCLGITSKVTTDHLVKLFPFWTPTEDQRKNLALKLQWNSERRII